MELGKKLLQDSSAEVKRNLMKFFELLQSISAQMRRSIGKAAMRNAGA